VSWSSTLLPGGQPLDILLPVKAASRIGGVGPRANPAATDVGIKRLRLGAQLRQGLLRGDPAHMASY